MKFEFSKCAATKLVILLIELVSVDVERAYISPDPLLSTSLEKGAIKGILLLGNLSPVVKLLLFDEPSDNMPLLSTYNNDST